MLIYSRHGGVGIVIHPDMDIMKVLNTALCESRLISKQDVSYRICVCNEFLREAIGKMSPLRNDQEERGFAFALFGVGEVTVHGAFSKQVEHR
jgi:hypothetical protein